MHENKSGMDRSKIIDTLKQRGGFITTGEVKSRGEYEQLRRAIEDGTLIRIRNGVYVEMSALANNMIDVERIVPHGVLCLYSAFAHYGLSTQVYVRWQRSAHGSRECFPSGRNALPIWKNRFQIRLWAERR